MLMAHATEAPRVVSDLVEGIDKKFAGLIGKCLNKRAEQRPAAHEITKGLAD
jgi:hypothetical protein